MVHIWVTFIQEYPWVYKLPLVDCLQLFYYYSTNDKYFGSKVITFEQSIKDKGITF